MILWLQQQRAIAQIKIGKVKMVKGMTVYDLADLYINDGEDMEIWNSETDETVFRGTFDEAKDSDFAYCEVSTFGIENGKIVINI